MKLSNPFMKLVVLVDGKAFEVGQVAMSVEEAYEFCRNNLGYGVIASSTKSVARAPGAVLHIIAKFDPMDGSGEGWADPKPKKAEPISGLSPRIVWTDPDSKMKWLMFEYNGTFEEYRAMPQFLKYDGEVYTKTGHNSDTGNVSYRQHEQSKIAHE